MGEIINGKEFAKMVRAEVKAEIDELEVKVGRRPNLTVILVGEDEASKVYVRQKEKVAAKVGIESVVIKLESSISEVELIDIINDLNAKDYVDGILVQLPLPKQISTERVIETISPHKDVDGFHPINMGKLMTQGNGVLPCTPSGIIEILDRCGIDIKGKNAVVVGRSNIVGKPVAMLLMHRHATVTICHSRTRDLREETLRAEILVSAVGQPHIITEDMVRQNAVVIDVGISRMNGKLIGDVDFDNVLPKASYITPVPGGVGPMTVAMLMKNTLTLYKRRNGIA